MTLAVQIPEIEPLLNADTADFVLFAAKSLHPHRIHSASFNRVSGAPLAAALKDKIYLLSFDHQPFVRAAVEVFTAYDQTKTVGISLREKFLIAYAKDKLRHLPRQTYDAAMAKVTKPMQSIGSLVWSPETTPRPKSGFNR